MSEISLREATSSFGRKQLAMWKRKAVRAGVWFKSLARIDRVLIDLTMKVTQSVRSPSLARRVFAVLNKLEVSLESRIARDTNERGFRLARKLGLLAQKWGNKTAWGWMGDAGFARYLAIIELNG